MFSPGRFSISGSALRSLILLELNFVQGDRHRSNFILLYPAVFPAPFCWRCCLFFSVCFWHLHHISCCMEQINSLVSVLVTWAWPCQGPQSLKPMGQAMTSPGVSMDLDSVCRKSQPSFIIPDDCSLRLFLYRNLLPTLTNPPLGSGGAWWRCGARL